MAGAGCVGSTGGAVRGLLARMLDNLVDFVVMESCGHATHANGARARHAQTKTVPGAVVLRHSASARALVCVLRLSCLRRLRLPLALVLRFPARRGGGPQTTVCGTDKRPRCCSMVGGVFSQHSPGRV